MGEAVDEPVGGPTSVNQTLEGKAMPKNASDKTAVDRKWEYVLYATPTTGQPGIAKVTAKSVFKKHQEKKKAGELEVPKDSRCSASAPLEWGADLTSLTWTQDYGNGSSFEGKAKNKTPPWPVCTDGNAFFVKVEGEITKGKGEFKDVKGGDWTAEITVSRICNPGGDWCPVEGTFEANNLTYK